MIRSSREGEEQVGQAIDVADEHLIDRRTKGHHAPLGSPADRPRDVQRGGGRRSAREDESSERPQFGLEAVDERFEPRHMLVGHRGFGNPAGNLLHWIRQLRTQPEQIALDTDECGVEVGIELRRSRETHPRVQLVDLAIRVDAVVGLADARPIEERRLACITGSRVEFHGWFQ